jgi:hypothetical protein
MQTIQGVSYPILNDQTRLLYDPCARRAYDRQSVGPGSYEVSTPGYRWCETPASYAIHQTEPAQFQKVYPTGCYVNTGTLLTHSALTNMRYINQLFARPYGGSFMGAGQRSLGRKDLETELFTGLDTRGGPRRACDVLSGVSIDRFECLPEYGNPQRVEHIVVPWQWGGANSRDYVRRVNYEARCLNNLNQRIINGDFRRPPSERV